MGPTFQLYDYSVRSALLRTVSDTSVLPVWWDLYVTTVDLLRPSFYLVVRLVETPRSTSREGHDRGNDEVDFRDYLTERVRVESESQLKIKDSQVTDPCDTRTFEREDPKTLSHSPEFSGPAKRK